MCLHVAVLVDVLRAHGTESAGMAEQGCRAIARLALKDAANRTALVAAGACEGE